MRRRRVDQRSALVSGTDPLAAEMDLSRSQHDNADRAR